MKRGGGKVSRINREQKVVHWSRKGHPKLLPKKEAAVPIKPPICCAALSHQEGLPGGVSSCEDFLLIVKRFWLCSPFCCDLPTNHAEMGLQRG